MLKTILRISLVLVFVSSLFAQNIDSKAILSQIDALVSYPQNDFSAEYTVTEEKPGQGRTVTKFNLFRRDRNDAYTIIILEPAIDKGKGYLKIGNNLWLYDPVANRFNVTSAKDRFQNTNARNSDFTQSTLADDYIIINAAEAKLGAYDTTVYTLEAVTEAVTYPSMKIWVDNNGLVRMFEDYSLSGQHMRTTAITQYQRLGEHYVPISIMIIDQLRGAMLDGQFRNERTVISVSRASLRDVPDLVFSRNYLEQVSQ